MTRAEKVREAIIDAIPVASLYGSSGETARLNEALSLLDGCVIVPRKATEEMLRAGAIAFERVGPTSAEDEAYIQDGSVPIEDRIALAWRKEAVAAWSAMITASDERE